MLWFILSLLTALSDAARNVFSKHALKDFDEYILAFVSKVFALPFLLPLLLFVEVPVLDRVFWIALFAATLLNVFSAILFMRAIKLSPLSLSIPFVTFTPVFLLVTSPIMLNEFPSLIGLSGILFVVLGSYLLNVQEMKKNVFEPFKILLREKGSLLMLAVAFLWSITSNIDKIAVLHSNPILYVIVFHLFSAVFLTPIAIVKSNNHVKQIPFSLKRLMPVGLFSALVLIFQMFAINIAIVPYVISVKRMTVLFSILFGFVFFREANVKSRLFGAFVMLLGTALMLLG